MVRSQNKGPSVRSGWPVHVTEMPSNYPERVRIGRDRGVDKGLVVQISPDKETPQKNLNQEINSHMPVLQLLGKGGGVAVDPSEWISHSLSCHADIITQATSLFLFCR